MIEQSTIKSFFDGLKSSENRYSLDDVLELIYMVCCEVEQQKNLHISELKIHNIQKTQERMRYIYEKLFLELMEKNYEAIAEEETSNTISPVAEMIIFSAVRILRKAYTEKYDELNEIETIYEELLKKYRSEECITEQCIREKQKTDFLQNNRIPFLENRIENLDSVNSNLHGKIQKLDDQIKEMQSVIKKKEDDFLERSNCNVQQAAQNKISDQNIIEEGKKGEKLACEEKRLRKKEIELDNEKKILNQKKIGLEYNNKAAQEKNDQIEKCQIPELKEKLKKRREMNENLRDNLKEQIDNLEEEMNSNYFLNQKFKLIEEQCIRLNDKAIELEFLMELNHMKYFRFVDDIKCLIKLNCKLDDRMKKCIQLKADYEEQLQIFFKNLQLLEASVVKEKCLLEEYKTKKQEKEEEWIKLHQDSKRLEKLLKEAADECQKLKEDNRNKEVQLSAKKRMCSELRKQVDLQKKKIEEEKYDEEIEKLKTEINSYMSSDDNNLE